MGAKCYRKVLSAQPIDIDNVENVVGERVWGKKKRKKREKEK